MSMSSTRIMYDFIVYYNNIMYALCSKAFKLIVISEKSTKLKCFCLIFYTCCVLYVYGVSLYSKVNA